jgi:hypothetical protein
METDRFENKKLRCVWGFSMGRKKAQWRVIKSTNASSGQPGPWSSEDPGLVSSSFENWTLTLTQYVDYFIQVKDWQWQRHSWTCGVLMESFAKVWSEEHWPTPNAKSLIWRTLTHSARPASERDMRPYLSLKTYWTLWYVTDIEKPNRNLQIT